MAQSPLRLVLASIFALLASVIGAGARAEDGAGSSSLRQIAGILDYIAGDYAGAVAPDGRVLDEGEYKEQRSLAGDAEALAVQAGLAEGTQLRRELAALSQGLAERRAPDAIAQLCKQARATLVTQHGLALGPAAPPSREDGARLY